MRNKKETKTTTKCPKIKKRGSNLKLLTVNLGLLSLSLLLSVSLFHSARTRCVLVMPFGGQSCSCICGYNCVCIYSNVYLQLCICICSCISICKCISICSVNVSVAVFVSILYLSICVLCCICICISISICIYVSVFVSPSVAVSLAVSMSVRLCNCHQLCADLRPSILARQLAAFMCAPCSLLTLRPLATAPSPL